MKVIIYVVSAALMVLLGGCCHQPLPDFESFSCGGQENGYRVYGYFNSDFRVLIVAKTMAYLAFVEIDPSGPDPELRISQPDGLRLDLVHRQGIYIIGETGKDEVVYSEARVTWSLFRKFRAEYENKENFTISELQRFFEIKEDPVPYKVEPAHLVSSEFITGDGGYCVLKFSKRDKCFILVVLKTGITSNEPGVILSTEQSSSGDKIAISTEDTGKIELKNKHGIYIFDDTDGPAVYFYEKNITSEQYKEFETKCGNKRDFVMDDLIRFFDLNKEPVSYYGSRR